MEVLQRTANRGSIATGAAYEIENSLKLNSANSEYLYQTRDTSGSDWNRLKWTASMWVKHIPTPDSNVNPKERMFGAADANSDFDIRFRGEPLGFRNNSDVDGAAELRTTALYRDYSAWYHVVAVWDTANATAGDRMKLYVNGEEVTDFSVDTQPSLNAKSIWGKKNDGTDGNVTHTIGAFYNYYTGFSQGLNGYMAEIHWVEGQALTPTDFGVYDNDSGIWKPKAFTGTLGSLDNYLDFSNSSNLGEDANGGTDLSLNNITAADQATDTPTNNFCTWNPLFSFGGNEAVINEGATTADSVSGGWKGAVGTIAATNGKWYWEYRPVAGAFGYRAVGIMGADYSTDDIDDPRDYCPNLFLRDGLSPYIYQHLISGVETAYKAMTSWSSNDSDVFAIALNLDDEEITFYRNGTAITENGTSNTTFSISSVIGQSEPIVPYYRSFDSTEIYFNFGGYTEMTIASGNTDANGYGTFEYAPPSGYYALCTKNLAEYG